MSIIDYSVIIEPLKTIAYGITATIAFAALVALVVERRERAAGSTHRAIRQARRSAGLSTLYLGLIVTAIVFFIHITH